MLGVIDPFSLAPTSGARFLGGLGVTDPFSLATTSVARASAVGLEVLEKLEGLEILEGLEGLEGLKFRKAFANCSLLSSGSSRRQCGL